MTILDKMSKELSIVISQGFFSINFESDNKTIKYLYLDGKFDDHELLLAGAIFSKYKGRDGYEVV